MNQSLSAERPPVDISIVTVVRNSAATIRSCIESVRMQSLAVEHIIVDGASSDGTLAEINECRSENTRVISERVPGIYHAMNQGLALARGQIVGTLNADDFYAHTGVLARVAAVFADREIASCYGDLVYVDSKDTSRIVRYWRSGAYSVNRFYNGWMPPHPTFFIRKRCLETFGFYNTGLGSAADYELMLRMLLRYRITTCYIPEVLVKMRQGGVSNLSLKNRLHANKMDRLAWPTNGLKPHPWTLWMKPLRKVGQFFERPRNG